MQQQIEAVFENGAFRPLRPIHLPEHQRLTVLLPAIDEEAGYESLPLEAIRPFGVIQHCLGTRLPVPNRGPNQLGS